MNPSSTETVRPLSWLLLATHVPASGQGGGVVRYTVELARALAERDDVDLHLLTRKDAADPLARLTGARTVAVPALPRVAMSLVEYIGVGMATRGRRFDVVQGAKHLVPAGRSRAIRVLTVHDTILLDRPQDFDRVKRTLLTTPYRRSLAAADVLLNVSAATRDRVEAHVPRPHVSDVVWLATAPQLLSVTPAPVEALSGRRYALVVGDPSPRKNLPLLVDSWKDVLDEAEDAVLAVVGPDSWGDTVHGRAFDDLVSRGRLVRLSGLSDAQLRWAYENATVALCPSRSEGFGLPAVEALDLGTPLITSNDAALAEVSGAAAPHLSPDDARAWVAALVDEFRSPRPHVPRVRPRSWADVAEESVSAVRSAF